MTAKWNEPQSLDDAIQFCRIAIKSGLVPGIKSVEQAVTIAIAGAELGMGVMASLRAFHIMSGRAVMAAQTLVAIAQRSPECESFRCIETTHDRATYEAQRRGGKPVRRTYTMDDARTAGIDRGPTWRKYPKAMLRWRCSASLARDLFADVLGGFVSDDFDDDTLTPSAPLAITPLQAAVHAVAHAPADNTDQPAPTSLSAPSQNSDIDLERMTNDLDYANDVQARREAMYAQQLKNTGCERWQDAARTLCEELTQAGVFDSLELARKALALQLKQHDGPADTNRVVTAAVDLEILHLLERWRRQRAA